MVKIKVGFFALVGAFFCLLAGCAEERHQVERVDPEETTAAEAPAVPEDEELLLLIRQLPIGSTYERVRALFPDVSALEPEGTLDPLATEQRLEEARAGVYVFNRPVALEFNFENGVLYSYYFWIMDFDCQAAETLYQRLQAFYGEHYGAFEEERFTEGEIRTESSYWRTPTFGISMTNTIREAAQLCTLAWGFQEQPPNGGTAG